MQDDLNPSAEGAKGSSFTRRSVLTALVIALLAPFVLWGSDQGLRSMFNAPLFWVDEDASSRRQFNDFLDLFGAHEMVVISWIGCEIDDPRLMEVAVALQEVRDERARAGKLTLVNQVLSEVDA